VLTELTVRNLALIEALTITFGPGANLMTGETGAGKSILVGALGLLTGRRGGAELVRAGAEEAEVAGLFHLADPEAFAPLLAEQGLAPTDELLLRRVVNASGRGRAYIGGAPASVAQLARLGDELLSISGQHEQQSLTRPGRLLDYLDRFGGHAELLAEMTAAWTGLTRAAGELAALEESLREDAEKRDLYEFQLEEIKKLNPRPDEDEELLAEKNAARHSGRLAESLAAAVALLGGEPGNVVEKLGRVRRGLETAAGLEPRLAEGLATAETCAHQLADLAAELEIFSRNLEVSPERLEWVEDRLNDLAKVRRKYGLTLAELIARGRRLAEILDRLDGAGLDRARLAREKEAALARALTAAERLSQARRGAADHLVARLTAALRPLGFPKMTMEVELETPEEKAGRLGPSGFDRVDFLFSPNPGEGRAPLGRIASGGELSRVLLALKTVEDRPGDQMLVFDEIDAGLGGVAAEAVAGSLAELAGRRQLVIITHLPRVAALPGRHFRVVKGLAGDQGRTMTDIIPLEPRERVEELARMLGGAAPSPEAAALAERLLGG
jgi:DNA repair protein RecN (Recombination protein N)